MSLRLLFLALLTTSLVACSGDPASGGSTPSGSSDSSASSDGGGVDGSSAADGSRAADGGGGSSDTASASDANGGDDAPTSTADSQGGGAADSSAAVDSGALDTVSADATVKDSASGDTAATDAAATDTSKDSGAIDGGSADIQPSKCTADKDCPKGFGDCFVGKCNLETGKCTLAAAADGTTCAVKGPCGGQGSCKQGACSGADTCTTGSCQPKPLQCGDKVVLDVAALGPSQIGGWPCSDTPWSGGEQAFALSSDVSQAAEVAVAAGGAGQVHVFHLSPAAGGQCNPKTCLQKGENVVVGLPAGVTQTLMVETKAGLTGSVTVTVTCSVGKKCGDGQCQAGETCDGCPVDCGKCKTCGDGTCDKKTENCGGCPEDCGECNVLPLPECATKATPSKPGEFACSECVCKKDAYCCQNAWDGLCVSQCTQDCGGPLCSIPAFCGDGECNGNEGSGICPADCGDTSKCGDGQCLGGEACQSCPLDCGVCPNAPAPPACGDGKCTAPEHCGVCPADCGVCSADCASIAAKNTPGCPGCACEAAVCQKDTFCCKTAWDSLCVSQCLFAASMTCPKDACGDGVCSGPETCSSCNKDCGACVCGDGVCSFPENDTTCAQDCVKCGDGKCSPGETKDSCKADCGFGCEGKCGKPSSDGMGGMCYCDSLCEQAGDCCPDKKTFCP
jgi:hypothetical protein